LEDLGIGRRIIIAVCVLEKQRGKMWTGFNWVMIGTFGGSCVHDKEASDSMKRREIHRLCVCVCVGGAVSFSRNLFPGILVVQLVGYKLQRSSSCRYASAPVPLRFFPVNTVLSTCVPRHYQSMLSP
jgi:hypothetical protein